MNETKEDREIRLRYERRMELLRKHNEREATYRVPSDKFPPVPLPKL